MLSFILFLPCSLWRQGLYSHACWSGCQCDQQVYRDLFHKPSCLYLMASFSQSYRGITILLSSGKTSDFVVRVGKWLFNSVCRYCYHLKLEEIDIESNVPRCPRIHITHSIPQKNSVYDLHLPRKVYEAEDRNSQESRFTGCLLLLLYTLFLLKFSMNILFPCRWSLD